MSIIVTWYLGIKIVGGHKFVLAIGVVYHVVILFVFKYLTFFAQQTGLLLNKDLSIINISLPTGISFFTFQMISYLVDVYNKKVKPQRNLLWVGMYVAFFPQLIAGPIIRYEKIENEITYRHETYDDVVHGMKKFIYGLAKKVLLANYLAEIADNIFDYMAIGHITVAMAWLGAICYTLQIYYDFSGYSDMAIGLARMFGFHFDENFNYPYVAKSVTEFWRRWHISLSSWFRDYVYIPLGGNRVSKPRWILNYFVVWLLTGIWHGANWTFVVWGLVYFVVLIFEKMIGISEKLGWFSHIYTILIVIIAKVIFRAENIKFAFGYIGYMFGVGNVGLCDVTVMNYIKSTIFVLIASCIGVTPFIKNTLDKLRNTKVYFVESIFVGIIFVLSLFQVVSSTYNPFIYFNF
jgi:D-alanyl-lipoteichoic acid acyltransferase DltB (MBOAT superfamily)